MESYNFDTYIERKGTNCIKFDSMIERGKPEDVLSFWVADMDFETVREVKEAIIKRAEHGIYGYTRPDHAYYQAVRNWLEKRYGFATKEEWILYTPGIVFALAAAIKALTKEGEGVLIQRPVYYPFSHMVTKNDRILVNNPLVHQELADGTIHYEIDFADFEKKIVEHNVKLFVLCNPHNPVGRVWTKEELRTLGNICLKHGVIVISDEIHADFIAKGHKHLSFSTVEEEFANITVTCTSPSKTFNLAGVQISNIIVQNKEIRDKIRAEIDKTGYDEPNIFGIEACKAAYEYGEAWLEQLKEYLAGNVAYVTEYLKTNLPNVKITKLEGTYLMWLDFSAYSLTNEELEHKIVHEAKLWLDAGTMFGEEGSLFERINVATSRAYLTKAMEALKRSFAN